MPVLPDENITRFATSKHHYRPSDNTIKWNAFMPDRNGETSVFRTSGLSEDEIWAIGDREIRRILGRGDIIASRITEKGLRIVPDDTPERHANILGWSDYDERSKNRLIALQLERDTHQFHLI